jgi:hypothetical protein
MRRHVPTFARLLSACAVIALLCAPAASQERETVVEVRGGETPLFLWDVTPAVGDIVEAKAPRESALHALEARAIDVLATQALTSKDAKRLSLRVLYLKTGATDPTYKSPTFEGIERLFEVSADADAIRERHVSLAQALGAGHIPAEVHLTVSGVLPPL